MKNAGFTLIELATVIAIIAILAAVAIPRLVDASARSECANIQSFKNQLTSAASIYTVESGAPPSSFTDFVTTGVMPPAGPGNATISIQGFGPRASSCSCTVDAVTISCTGAFHKYNPSYTFTNGVIMMTRPVPTAQAGVPVCQ